MYKLVCLNQKFMKKSDDYKEYKKLTNDQVREKITKALVKQFNNAGLLDFSVYSTYAPDKLTYSLNTNGNISFHEVEYYIIMNEVQILWEKSKRIKPPKKRP